ncbi:MAG: helix-turn-helix transcriptional regulator [Pirellulales bacterium]|nr:helix-turn-helix transcriptional regulator [Pirellulales bacterium]
MSCKPVERIECRRVELDGLRYVIVRESVFENVCRRAGISRRAFADGEEQGLDLDGAALAERLVLRRRAAGLSQTALARRAGIRPETLNRIERGRTTPDFATIRKLVLAINAAEDQTTSSAPSSLKENRYARKK